VDQSAFNRLQRMGALAAQLLANEVFLEMIADLKQRSIVGWTDAYDPISRENHWRDIQATGRLENYLKDKQKELELETKRLDDMHSRERLRNQYRETLRG
jgi:hypothetical protein